MTKAKIAKPPFLLSEFTERINAHARRAAMDAYFASDIHSQMLLASAFAEQCRTSTRNLTKGALSPQLDVCCCDGTFATILTCDVFVTYEGCSLPEATDDEDDPTGETEDRELTATEYARLSKLSGDRLLCTLVEEFDCSRTTYSIRHEADGKAQSDYYKALLARAETAARYAKAIGSESALLWLEVLRLLQPKVDVECSMRVASGLDLVPKNVEKAYAVAEEAQALLWTDDRFRRLAPLKKSAGRTR